MQRGGNGGGGGCKQIKGVNLRWPCKEIVKIKEARRAKCQGDQGVKECKEIKGVNLHKKDGLVSSRCPGASRRRTHVVNLGFIT